MAGTSVKRLRDSWNEYMKTRTNVAYWVGEDVRYKSYLMTFEGFCSYIDEDIEVIEERLTKDNYTRLKRSIDRQIVGRALELSGDRQCDYRIAKLLIDRHKYKRDVYRTEQVAYNYDRDKSNDKSTDTENNPLPIIQFTNEGTNTLLNKPLEDSDSND